MVSLEEPVFLYVAGTAGCGKTRFTHGFSRWMEQQGVDAVTVNLDPGAEYLPYTPDVDIRDWILLQDVMDEYNLGPNGAQIMAADLLAIKAGEIKEVLDTFRTDYFLMDTPGQTELFVFRESGRIVMDVFGPDRSMLAFLMDPFLARRPSAFVSQLLLSATTQFRFRVPVLNALTKTDLIDPAVVEKLLEWGGSPDALQGALMDESRPDLYDQLNLDVFRVLEAMGPTTGLISTSSETLDGFEDLYARIQEIYAGGEDITRPVSDPGY